ncbi:hypothetical protein BLNAU_15351 [Blattamonas nauphoetae]|uniref:Protein kinase domain-containing protein n=1 Tax=Blattamonas nauphoetae TaxID=2049346 RepID=A0ABQ9XEP2_9EUKA|nr:hypothetical protein BLNAU_15351 [Blattamonas nauphoetae]
MILIPCSLFLEVFEIGKDGTEFNSTQIPLTVDSATSFTETKIIVTLASSSLESLDASLEWRGRLVFGENQTSPNNFLIQQSSSGRFAQAVKDNMKWWIPLVVVLSCAVLALILIVILLVRHHNKNKWRKSELEEEPQELNEAEEKIEVVKDECYNEDNQNSVHTAGQKQLNPALTFHDSHSSILNTNNVAQALPGQTAVLVVDEDQFGHPKIEDGLASQHDTLFNRLHRRDGDAALNIHQTRLDVAKAIEKLLSLRQDAVALRRLNPHWVFYTPTNMICFRLNEERQSLGSTGIASQSGVPKTTQEEKRWSAPEEANRENDIDAGKVLVFRLGLILWEITTGQIPFGETDAVNAQRQLGMGVVPRMDSVEPVELATLLLECLDLNPISRPSVESVISRLESIKEERKEAAGDLLELPNRSPEPHPKSPKPSQGCPHE